MSVCAVPSDENRRTGEQEENVENRGNNKRTNKHAEEGHTGYWTVVSACFVEEQSHVQASCSIVLVPGSMYGWTDVYTNKRGGVVAVVAVITWLWLMCSLDEVFCVCTIVHLLCVTSIQWPIVQKTIPAVPTAIQTAPERLGPFLQFGDMTIPPKSCNKGNASE